jgi:hypothetical protein
MINHNNRERERERGERSITTTIAQLSHPAGGYQFKVTTLPATRVTQDIGFVEVQT